MPPTFGQPPIPLTQPRSGHVALDDRPPAAELDEAAMVAAVLRREVARLVEGGAVAALVRGPPEQRDGPQLIVELGRRRQPSEVQHQVEQHLGHVVRLRRAARDADDGEPGLRLPVPAEVVRQAHRARRVVLHRGDAAVGRARPDRDDGGCLVREPVDPLVRRDRLAVLRVHAEAGEVSLPVDLLVRDRALDDQDERIELALLRVVPGLDELLADLVGDHLVVDHHPGHAGDDPLHDVLEARIGRRGHGDRIALARQSRRHPQHVRRDLLGRMLLRGELDARHAQLPRSILVNRCAAADRRPAGRRRACRRRRFPSAPSRPATT